MTRTFDLRFGCALVIGGTGMLAGASAYLARQSRCLVLGARHPETLAEDTGAMYWNMDWHERAQTLSGLAALPVPDIALVWVHTEGAWLVPHVRDFMRRGGRLIQVHGSAALDPAVLAARAVPSAGGVRVQNVVLGRMPEGNGFRWLTHTEISLGVIGAISRPDTEPVIVGHGPDG